MTNKSAVAQQLDEIRDLAGQASALDAQARYWTEKANEAETAGDLDLANTYFDRAVDFHANAQSVWGDFISASYEAEREGVL